MKLPMNYRLPVRLAVAALMVALIASPVARASTITFVTPGGSSVGDGPVDASATFTTSAGTLTIALQDLLNNPTSVGQTLNGVNFKLSDGDTVGSLSSQTGTRRTVTGTGPGQYTDDASTPYPTSLLWNYYGGQNSNGSPTPGVDEVTSLGNMAAKPTIIGGPDSNNAYSAANGSITSGTHDPFLAGTVTVVLNIPSVDASTTISSMNFLFGTSEGEGTVPGFAIPEPSTLALAVAGLSATSLGGILRLRRRS
jgi:hypothetical protein